MTRKAKSERKSDKGVRIGFEDTLWLVADKIRNNLDAAEYKHVVLNGSFLNCISDG